MSELVMTRGDLRDITLTVTDENGAAYNLTGKRVRWMARPSVNTATVAITKAIGTGITIATPSSGVAVVRINPVDTTGFTTQTRLLWDCQIDDNPGNEATVGSGTLIVLPDITI